MKKVTYYPFWVLIIPAMVVLVLLSIVIFPKPAEAVGPTYVGGSINEITTWTLAGSPYIITADIIVQPQATLTIEAGVQVKAQQNRAIIVTGQLLAQGTSSSPIIFTADKQTPLPGSWKGIYFYPGSEDSSVIDCATIEYGGAAIPQSNIWINDASPTISNSLIRNSSFYGITVSGSNAAPVIRSNAIINNYLGGIWIDSGNPDIGTAGNPGKNCLHSNGSKDIYNTSGDIVSAEGNYWDCQHITYPAIASRITNSTEGSEVDFDPWLMYGQSAYSPVAVADSYNTYDNTPLSIAAQGVLGNDTNSIPLHGSAFTAIKVSDPLYGTLTLNTNGSFTYTPNAAWSGADSFTYKVNDGMDDSNTVTVTIKVHPIDDTPPTTPLVTDDGDYTISSTQLHATWMSSDDKSGVAEYRYAIGTTPRGIDMLGWTTVGTDTEATATGLSLNAGTNYYISVKAKNGSGVWSDVGTSDGIIYDNTSPSTPVVTDDGGYTTSTSQLHAAWSSVDNESAIAEYEYAIGTSAGKTNVVSWTSAGTATEVTATGLRLTAGKEYYISVKAKNGVGLWSEVGTSDGIVCDNTPPSTPVVTVDEGYTTSTSQLHAAWSSVDNESTIAEYEYAIGTSAGETDVVGWTSAMTATEATPTGLGLTTGTKYYISVKAKNGAGQWSDVGVSSAIAVVPEGTVQKDIPSSGVNVQTKDSRVVVEFPAGAVTGTATVIITEVASSSIPEVPKGYKMGSSCFNLEAIDGDGNAIHTFSKPVTLSVKYTDDDVAAVGGDPNNLVLAYWDDAAGKWQVLDTTVDETDKILSVTSTHFSLWAVLAQTDSKGQPAWIWVVEILAVALGLGILIYLPTRRLVKK